MEIIINGIKEKVTSRNLSDLVTEKGLSHSTVIIEYNKKIVKKDNWNNTVICQNDEIEILNFVGGG